MFYSLMQTLFCVLLINGGLYALHLKGTTDTVSNNNGAKTSSGGANEPAVLLQQVLNQNREHVQHASPGSAVGRLTEELADLAQLERERLMLLGIAKQTAAANAAAATGHHGRPIITGRIHMTPAEDLIGDTDYAGLLMPGPARGYMFGHVVKQPVQQSTDELATEFTGGGINEGGNGLRPAKYEYGRMVQPPVIDTEYDSQQHIPLDLDAFVELEQEPEPNEDDFDLDSYQYLDELLAEQQQQQQQRDWQDFSGSASSRAHNPFQLFEEIENEPPLALRELFHKEQHNKQTHQQQQKLAHQQQQQQQRNNFNMRLQQKWQRKRAQLPQLQRNIFGQKKHTLLGHQEPQDQESSAHYFSERHRALLANGNSEATAKSNNQNKNNEKTKSAKNILDEQLKSAIGKSIRNAKHNEQEQQQQQQQQQQTQDRLTNHNNNNNVATDNLQEIQKQKQEQQEHRQPQQSDKILVHPNHKRSGGVLMPPGLSTAGSHSIASQLMLRSARGQRQYDVPQIGKSINLCSKKKKNSDIHLSRDKYNCQFSTLYKLILNSRLI